MYDFSRAIELIFRFKLFKEITNKVVFITKEGFELITFENTKYGTDNTSGYYYYKSLNSGEILDSMKIINGLKDLRIIRIDCKGENYALEYTVTIDVY